MLRGWDSSDPSTTPWSPSRKRGGSRSRGFVPPLRSGGGGPRSGGGGAGPRSDEGGYHLQYLVAVVGQLGLADAVDGGERRAGSGFGHSNLSQRAVVEDDVGRNVLRLRLGRSPGAQGFEERLIQRR